jgi:hypothetical protein
VLSASYDTRRVTLPGMPMRPGSIVLCAVGTTLFLTTAAYVGCTGLLGTCTRADEKLADKLDRLEILDSRPAGATRHDDHYSGCDDDDRFAYAGQEYRWTGARDDVMAFYRRAAEQGGWRLEQIDPPPFPQREQADHPPLPPTGRVTARSPLCFSKSVAGTTGYLSLSFPSDLGEGTGNDYTIYISASNDDEGGC